MVIGSRYTPGSTSPGLSPLRSLMSRVGNLVLRLATRSPMRDMTSGFRVMTAEVAQRFHAEPEDLRGYNFLSAFAATTHARGIRVAEHPIVLGPRREGTSKLNRTHLKSFAANLPRLARRCSEIRRARATTRPGA